MLFLFHMQYIYFYKNILSADSTTGNGCILTIVLKMESDNSRQLINSLKQLNSMLAAENVLSINKKKYPIEPTRSGI